MPPHCPHYANDEFLAAENWKYYMSQQGGNSVSVDGFLQAIDDGKQLWTERREHVTHCVYMLLSVAQIMRDKTPYIPRLANYDHLNHCAKLILSDLRQTPNWTSIETVVPPIHYESC
jgi:hypothetical protein